MSHKRPAAVAVPFTADMDFDSAPPFLPPETPPSPDVAAVATDRPPSPLPVSRRATAAAAIAAAFDSAGAGGCGLGGVPVLIAIITEYYFTRTNFVLRLGGIYAGEGAYSVECYNPETDSEWQVIASLNTKSLRLGSSARAKLLLLVLSRLNALPAAGISQAATAPAERVQHRSVASGELAGILSAFVFDNESKLAVLTTRPGEAGREGNITECAFTSLHAPSAGGSGSLTAYWRFDPTLIPTLYVARTSVACVNYSVCVADSADSFGCNTLTAVIRDTVWVFGRMGYYWSLPLHATGADRIWTRHSLKEMGGSDLVSFHEDRFGAVCNDRFYFAGGTMFHMTERVVAFIPEKLTFSTPAASTIPPLPKQFASHSLCAYDGGSGLGMAVSGGASRPIPPAAAAVSIWGDDGSVDKQVWYAVFDDPQQRGWMALPNMIRCRSGHAMIAVGADLYVVGGDPFERTNDVAAKELSDAAYEAGSGGAASDSTVEHYSAATGKWRQIPSAKTKSRIGSHLIRLHSAD